MVCVKKEVHKHYINYIVDKKKRQIPSNRFILLLSDWFPISYLLRHFSVSPKLTKLQNISSKTSNSVKALDIVVIGLVSHFLIAKALLCITKINKVTEYFVKSMVEILQNCVAFSEYMNFITFIYLEYFATLQYNSINNNHMCWSHVPLNHGS